MAPLYSFVKKCRLLVVDTLREHLMASILVFLATAWLTISAGVYWFEHNAAGANITSYGDAVWWGIVTFLTVGYGDRFPVTGQGRFLASFLMLFGVGTVGVVTAKISSYFLEEALRKGRGLVDPSQLNDHFVVCGWKEEDRKSVV